MKKTIIFLLLMVLSGCYSTALDISSSEKASSIFSLPTGQSGGIDLSSAVSPYQYLNLFILNSDNFSLSYTVKKEDTCVIESCKIHKKGAMYSQLFTETDSNGSQTNVREVQKDGKDYFIIDSLKKIVVYNAPASEMLLFKMLAVSKQKHERLYLDSDFTVFEYKSATQTYRFYMKNSQLARLELLTDDKPVKTFEFSAIELDTADAAAFEIAPNYDMQIFDYSYANAKTPPWQSIK